MTLNRVIPISEQLKHKRWNGRMKAIIAILVIFMLLFLGAFIAFLVLWLQCESTESSTAPVTPTATPPPNPKYRLPKNFVPSHYDLLMMPHLPQTGEDKGSEGTFDGQVSIAMLCVQSTNTIVLNAQNISVLSAKMDHNAEINVTSIEVMEEVGMVKIELDQPLLQTREYTLHIVFKGYLQQDLLGFYTDFYMEDGKKKYFAVTQFESQFARRAFPCFDEPEYKATFFLQLRHPKDMIVLSNTAILHTESQGSFNVTQFDITPKMSTYLLAFFIGDFSCVNEQVADTQHKTVFRACMRKSMVNQGAFAADIGARLLAFYEKKYAIVFPLGKMDLLALSSFDAGAMENWGLITFRENDVLYNELYHAPTQLNEVAMTIAHELAHQWFGDLVTMRWWSDLWLNEGFADFMSYVSVKNVTEGLFHTRNVHIIDEMQKSMALDQLSNSHPIHQEASGTDEIESLFDSITYSKGASFINMLQESFFSEDSQSHPSQTWDNAITDYLSNRKHDNADYMDLVYYLKERHYSSGDLEEYTKRWILQMGYPMVTVTRTSDTTVELSQSVFTVGPNKRPPSPYNYQWIIKLFFYDFIETDQGITTRKLTTTIQPNETTTLRVNKNMSYYALNYDANQFIRSNYKSPKNWIDIFQSKVIRQKQDSPWLIQLIDDAFNLASAGHQPYRYAFCLVDLLNQTTDGQLYSGYLSWTAYFNNMNYISRMLQSEPSDVVEELNMYSTSILDKAWTYVNNDTADYGNHTEFFYLKRAVYEQGCRSGHADCVQQSLDHFNAYQKSCADPATQSSDPSCNKIPIIIRSVVYCTAVAQMGDKAFDFITDKYKIETIKDEKRNILNGLSCANDSLLIQRLLNETLDGFIDGDQVRYVYRDIVNNPMAGDSVWSFMVQYWEQLHTRHNFINDMVAAAAANFDTDIELKKIQDFLATHDDIGLSLPVFQQAVSKVESNIQWSNNYERSVVKVIQKFNQGQQAALCSTF